MNATEAVVSFVSETHFENIPREVVEKAKTACLDIIGLILAGSTEPCSRIAADFVREAGGTPVSTVIRAGFKSSQDNAALANGISAHALECDDADLEIVVHPSTVLMPAILAIGEASRSSGKDVLAAYIIGWEVLGGIGRAVQVHLNHAARGWHSTSTIGTFGAAAAAKLLKLDAHQTMMALGIAGSEASGSAQQWGTMGKPFNAGHAARNGVVAAMLAKKGFTAAPDILESPSGFFNSYNGPGNYDPAKVARKLGNPYTFLSPGGLIKKYGCVAPFQVPFEAMQELVRREGFSAEDVALVEDGVSPRSERDSRYPEPRSAIEARYSLPFSIAAGIAYPDLVGLAPYDQERVSSAKVRQLLKKVKLYAHPELASLDPMESLTVHYLRVQLKNGREFSVRADKARGYPGNPMSEAELLAKYRDCAGRVLNDASIEQSIELVNGLERLDHISELIKVLDSP